MSVTHGHPPIEQLAVPLKQGWPRPSGIERRIKSVRRRLWVVSGQPIDDQPLLQPCGINHEADGLSCLA